MSIRIERESEDYDPPHHLPSNSPTITKSIDSDTRYTCFLPPDWNGCLVTYTQLSSSSLLLDALCQEWLSQGYALAIAQFPETQLNRVNHHRQQLQSFFVKRCGTPRQVYEAGDVARQNPTL